MTDTQDIVVYDPRDGTVYETLADETTGALAHLALEFKKREQMFKGMREVVERELTGRVEAAGRKVVLVDSLELKVERARGRVWDGDELEYALRQLVDQGTLHAGELTGLITHETKVDGRQAAQLLGLLHGPALTLVQDCFRWETKGRPRLTITPSIELIPEET